MQLCTNVYIDRGSHTIKNIPIPIIYLCRYIHNAFSHSIIRNDKQCQLYYTHDDLMTILLLWMRGTFENELYYILYIYAYYIRVRYTHLYTYFFFYKIYNNFVEFIRESPSTIITDTNGSRRAFYNCI